MDSYCCNNSWDSICVSEAGVHDVFVQGAAKTSAESACVNSVCATRPACCSGSWDATCVALAGQQCLSRYVARSRVEDGRIMADACVEPRLGGTPACPLVGSGPTGRECCQRSLVLKGTYPAEEIPYDFTGDGIPDGLYGRFAKWFPYEDVVLPSGLKARVQSTLIADPAIRYRNGIVESTEPHHLWQAAGPGGTLYPDCSGTGGPRPCNGYFTDQMGDPTHTSPYGGAMPLRGLLTSVLAALITTDGHYEVDIRWQDSPQNSYLPIDSDFNTAPTEAVWTYYQESNGAGASGYVGKPFCFYAGARWRRAGIGWNGLSAPSLPCDGMFGITRAGTIKDLLF